MSVKFEVGDRVRLTEKGVEYIMTGMRLVSSEDAVVVGALGTVTYSVGINWCRVKFDADIRYKVMVRDIPMFDGSHIPLDVGEIEPAEVTP